MTKDPKATAKPVANKGWNNLKPFKKGYDKRRWLSGRGKKSPEQREGDEILRAVIWEELSREFDTTKNMQPLESSEVVDAFRLMVRGWIKKKPAEVADRIAGKVKQEIGGDLNGLLTIKIVKASDDTDEDQNQ